MDKLDLILQKLEKLDKLEVLFENEVRPQMAALAEGQQAMLEKLTPKSEVEKLRDEVDFLRDVLRLHSKEIQELKKAQ